MSVYCAVKAVTAAKAVMAVTADLVGMELLLRCLSLREMAATVATAVTVVTEQWDLRAVLKLQVLR